MVMKVLDCGLLIAPKDQIHNNYFFFIVLKLYICIKQESYKSHNQLIISRKKQHHSHINTEQIILKFS